MKSRLIRSEEEKQQAERVVSLLEYKVRKGLATEEEASQFQAAQLDLVIYDWPSWGEAKPHKRTLIAPAPRRTLPGGAEAAAVERPELTRRPGRFAV